MKMLLHLMAKDLRHGRRELIMFALCLAAAFAAPLIQRMMLEPHWSLGMAHIVSVIMVASLLMGLLVSWLALDHPQDTNGFMRTRPLPPVMRWLPKFLLWGLVLLVPTVLAMLVQLMGHGLELGTGQYAKFTARTVLRFIGIYGPMALVAAVTRHHRLAALLCLPVLVLGLSYQAFDVQLFVDEISQAHFQLGISRRLVALFVVGVGALVIAAMVLARRSWFVLLLALVGSTGVSLLAEHYWPVNLMSTRPVAMVPQPGRVAELNSQMKVKLKGPLVRMHSSPRYMSPGLELEVPAGTVEWPVLARHKLEELRVAGGVTLPFSQGSGLGDLGWNEVSQQAPEESLRQILGHYQGINEPHVLTEPRPRLVVHPSAPLPDAADLLMKGELDFMWFRPVVMTELLLEPGAGFICQGRSVKILEASSGGRRVHMTLRLTSTESWTQSQSKADQEAAFQLVAAHPGRREMALRGTSRSTGSGVGLVANELVLTVDYDVTGVDGQVVEVDASWVRGARLYILRREGIGSGGHRYEGEVKVFHLKSLP